MVPISLIKPFFTLANNHLLLDSGAGVGGVSTAARLARAGFQVTVLEKNNFTGGRCSLLHADGHRFDQGPSLLLLPQLFEQTFADLGTSLDDEGVELVKCEPNYRIWFGDGTCVRLSSDLATMKREIERWEGRDGYARYLDFLAESHAHYELSVIHVLSRNFENLLALFRPAFLRHLARLHPFESIWTRATKYFWTERLRRVFTFGSMYMGMSPFDAPGTYSLLQYTELAEGIWYPIGGFHRVVQALVDVGTRMGVEFRLQTPVQKVLLSSDGARAVGVVLESGEQLTADVVVNNSDLVYAYNTLLPVSTYAKSLSQRPGSCSSISFYWAMSQKVPELEAHNIFLADKYKESFDSIFKRHLIPDEPSFYVNVPSRVDPTAAPEGKDSIVVLVPVGHLIDSSKTTSAQDSVSTSKTSNGDIKSNSPSNQPGIQPTLHQDWPAMIALARKTIISTIASRTGVDLTPLITRELTNDPTTWRERFNLDRGAILGLSHSFFNVLCFRPSTRARRSAKSDAILTQLGVLGRILESLVDLARRASKDVKGLYMVGASSHPGTGVPIVLAGGKLVAEQICEDLEIMIPWHMKDVAKSQNASLDKMEPPIWLDSWQQWFVVTLSVAMVSFLLTGFVIYSHH